VGSTFSATLPTDVKVRTVDVVSTKTD